MPFFSFCYFIFPSDNSNAFRKTLSSAICTEAGKGQAFTTSELPEYLDFLWEHSLNPLCWSNLVQWFVNSHVVIPLLFSKDLKT